MKRQSSTQCGSLFLVLLVSLLFASTISSSILPSTPVARKIRHDSQAITSQYAETGPLSFNSDEEFRDWADNAAFFGFGTQNNPYVIMGLNISSSEGICLRMHNVTNTWFIFQDCFFRSNSLYPALEMINVSFGMLLWCYAEAVVSFNGTYYCDILESFFFEDVYVEDGIHTIFANNWFSLVADVLVGSIYRESMNVSFYENIFLGSLTIYDCSACVIIDNSFYGPVYDNGFNNEWYSNAYFDYDGSEEYTIPGSAASIDNNPQYLFEEPPPPGPFPWITTTSETATLWPSIPTLSTTDFILMGAIGFEIVLLALILFIRKERYPQ